jgi:hypothetical protein
MKTWCRNKLLNFYDDSDETSAGISQRIKKRLLENLLSIDNISTYSGENTTFHFAKQKSVFQKLKLLNPNIQCANFLAHILHKYTKQAGHKLQTDSKDVFLKIFSHFSSAKHTEELKTIFDFLGENRIYYIMWELGG